MHMHMRSDTTANSCACHAQGEDGAEFNEVAEILLQLQDNLTVNPRKRYTTRTVTGVQPVMLTSHACTTTYVHAVLILHLLCLHHATAERITFTA